MARYFRYQRGVIDGSVKAIGLHRFNNGEISVINEATVRVDAADADIAEWLSVQNCNPVELNAADTLIAEKAWEKTHGAQYGAYLVPFTASDAAGVLQVKAEFEVGITSTNIHFSNCTVMPITAVEFPAFAAWFFEKRNSYFI